jgi:phage-related minor tail protein
MTDTTTLTIRADTSQVQKELKALKGLSESFGAELTGALKSAATSGRDLEDVLRRLALNLSSTVLDAGLKPLQGLAGSFFSSLFGNLAGIIPHSKGGTTGGLTPFASGGVVSSPTLFNMDGPIGLMGEAGAEAILPLQRGADGRLGVAAGGQAAAVNVVFNVSAPDPAAFRKSEAQITGMLARAVARGSRTV